MDAEGAVVLRRQLRRNQVLEFFQRLGPCLVGMEGRQRVRHRFKHRWRRRGAPLGPRTRQARP